MAEEKAAPKIEYVTKVPAAAGRNYHQVNGKQYILTGGQEIPIRKDHLPFFKTHGVELNNPPKKK